MKFGIIAAAVLAFVAPAAAHAAGTITFNGVCANSATSTQAACTGLNGSYGNTVTLNATNDASVKVKISAWQANQSSGLINSAFLGAYSGGFGVTGVNDQSGNNGLHQFDNVNGYTDFVVLQFNQAVQLTGFGVNLYDLNGVSPRDSDASYANVGALISPYLAQWNSSLDLTGADSALATWLAADGNSTAGNRSVGAAGFSQVWLVGASRLTTDRDDGFKLSQIMVQQGTPPVPEPATWAMLIAGFGVVGATMRRRSHLGAAALV